MILLHKMPRTGKSKETEKIVARSYGEEKMGGDR